MIQSFGFVLLLMLTACGKKENAVKGSISNVSATRNFESAQEILFLQAEVGGNQVVFQDDILAIKDPVTGEVLGSVLMLRIGKINRLSVKLDATKARLAQSLLDLRLPNGSAIPVLGLDNVVAFPAGLHSKVYLGQKKDQVMLGVALAVEQFNNLADYIPGASFFFELDSAAGLGGFFTAFEPHKSGVAIMTDISGQNRIKFRQKAADFEQAQYFGYFVEHWKKSKTALKIK